MGCGRGDTLSAVLVGAVITLVLSLLGFTFYGLYLAFSASILLGVIVLFVEPAPLIFGVVKVFWGVDLAVRIIDYFSK